MKLWRVQVLTLCNIFDSVDRNSRPKIVEDVCHIHFPILTSLSIWANNIESVEKLPRVDMPQLRYLHLGMPAMTVAINNIRCVRVLRKGRWASLSAIFTCSIYWMQTRTLLGGTRPCWGTLAGVEEFVRLQGWESAGWPLLRCQTRIHQLEVFRYLPTYSATPKSNLAIERSIQPVLRRRWKDLPWWYAKQIQHNWR